jgi:single-strand DNA-binding protein
MINNVILMGRICSDVDLRTTNSGKSVANFRIAVDRSYSKNGNKETDFITIVVWENTADFVSKYFSKGSMIALRGEIQTRNYEDNSGNKRTAFEVIAREVRFCGDKNETSPAAAPATTTYAAAPATVPTYTPAGDDFEEIPDDSELPF